MKSNTLSAKKNPASDMPKDIRQRLNQLYGLCKKAMAGEQYGFRRRINRLRQSPKVTDRFLSGLKKLTDEMQASAEQRQWRMVNRPKLAYNNELPIVERKKEIIESIQNHQVTIISGETGSGKTTQIPKFCLEAGRGVDGLIGCTQPRRIAAITVAARIAEELGENPGQSVGYKIRFQDHTADTTFIKLMTDGILLAETQGDRWLNQYDTLIVDEAHERSLNIDFVLGILKTLVKKRRDLKLIITSATIDTEKFSKAFDDAPVIEVSGRMYPVDVRYMDFGEKSGGREDAEDKSDQTHVDLAVRAVEKLHQESPYGGDVLVFMPTEQDIREACELLEGRKFTGVTVMPLFARLSAADQGRVFRGITGRKVIVSTNVAETSLTIPGIKYVVDTGLARISQYLPRSRTTALPVIPVSRSSADQRKGRCGRVANGVCIRLYSEEDYENRPRFTPPEILRSNLAEVILRMISLRLGDIDKFPFIDRPAEKNIQDGFHLLEELGAIHRKKGRNGQSWFALTERGQQMARLPIDPCLSRMLLEASALGCLDEMTVIAAALSIQDPRERPAEKKALADKAHQIFKHPQSDFLTLLNIWKRYHETRAELKSIRKMRAYCKEHFLAFKRMREWRDIHYQLKMILKEQEIVSQGERPSDAPDNKRPFTPLYEAVHRAVLSGFLSNIAEKKEKFFYRAAKDREVMIFPGSGLFETGGKWVVAAEMVETSRLFARTVADIDVEWIEPIAGDQCKRIYLEPHWERKKGNVIAYEQVSLFGLLIVPRRPILFGRIDAEAASKIFIRNALVEGDMRQSFPFMRHNRSLIDQVRSLEDKVRRRDLLISEEDLFDFYESRLPKDIYDIRTLKNFLKTQKKKDDFLRMKEADLYRQHPDKEELSLYPDRVSLGNHVFPCDYHFDPGKKEDGVTVKIASALAPSVPSESVDWLVPGLLEEKIAILIKGLPKEYRKKLVPVNRTVETILKDIPVRREASLLSEMSAFIYKRFGVDVPASAWDENALPDHLKMRISIRGSGGREIRAGRDVSLLSKTPGEAVDPDGFEAAKKNWERIGIKEWDFGDLPETVPLKGENGELWTAYPGLKVDGEELMLTLFKERAAALTSHKKGVRRLFALRFAPDFKYLKKQVALPPNMKEPSRYFGGAKQVESQMVNRVQTDLFLKNIRTRAKFDDCAAKSGPLISTRARALFDGVCQVMSAYHDCRTALFSLENSSRNQPNVIRFLSELRDALANLAPENFVDLYEPERFVHLQRYIRAVTIRAERGVVSPEKDQAKWQEVKAQTDRLSVLLKELSPNVSDEKRQAVEDFFWLIEEFKVSLFAQELKTPVKVSAKRLEKQFGKIRRMI